MSNAFEPQHQEEPAVQSSGTGKGCLWGCLIAAGLFAAVCICGAVGTYFFVTGKVKQFTSTTPAELPTVEYTEEELTVLKERLKDFRDKADEGEVPDEDLVLTADDINALISSNEDFKGKVFVEIENDQVSGKVSFPLDAVPLIGKGRYFNGSATFDVSMDGGVLIVTMVEAEVKGEPVPDEIMEAMQNENLAKNLYSDPDQATFMRQFDDIRVEDDKLYLRFKRPEPGEESSEDGEAGADETSPDAVEAGDSSGGDSAEDADVAEPAGVGV